MKWWGLSFQDPICLGAQNLDWFHDYICAFLVLVLIFVIFFLIYLSVNNWIFVGSSEHAMLEFIWTVTPALVLILVGIPSMYILYSHSVEAKSEVSVKVTAHQWYWSYDYMDFPEVSFDSFLIPVSDLEAGAFRLLETDNRMIIPMKTEVRLAISSADVLHSWAMPTLGLKSDAVPGRTNFMYIFCDLGGLYYGQCSEICGANHSFMPISMEVSGFNLFKAWLLSF